MTAERPNREEPAGQIDDILSQAGAAYEALRLDEALALYSRAAAAEPNCYEAHLGLARTHRRRREHAEARVSAERCLELDPARPEGYSALGALCFLTDRYDEAKAALQQALERDAQDLEARLTLAQVHADRRAFGEARRELERARAHLEALGQRPERPGLEALAWHVETYILLAEGNDAKAREAAQRVIALQDANPHAASLAYSNLGILEARARRYDEAINYLERAYSMNPFFQRAGGALGRLLLLRQRNERAAEVLAGVLGGTPEASGSTHYAYGMALVRLRRRDEARAQFALALRHGGLSLVDRISAYWQTVWLHPAGRYVLLGVPLAALTAWLLLGQPSPQALTFVGLLVLLLVLQRSIGRRR